MLSVASIWQPTWLHFGTVLAPILGPSWLQMAQKIDSKIHQKTDAILYRFLVDFGTKLDPNLGEPMFVVMLVYVGSWSHLGAKMAPGPPQEAPKPPLGPILEPTWHQLGLQNRPKSPQIAICICPCMHVYMHAWWLPDPAIPGTVADRPKAIG